MADEPAIIRRVREWLAAHRPPVGPMVVAVSGGPDSVALLRALRAVHSGPLVVAHVNHGFRGAASDADQLFVGDLVQQLARDAPRIGLRVVHLNKTFKTIKQNVEAAARQFRYRWMTEVAREASAGWVATGHTADDQAETVLFQLLRGTGLDGLAGIAASRRLADGVELIRPLLNVTRAEVLAYLHSLGQDYRVDATNADTTRTRSRIRHKLLPLLANDYNPQVVAVLGRLAKQANDWRRDQSVVVAELLKNAERPRAGSLLIFDGPVLAAAPRRRRRALFRSVWQREGWPRSGMGFREWDRLARFCRGGETAIDLPGRMRVRRRGNVIQIGPIDGGI